MIFLSAGHNTGGPKPDPGAVANGVREADLAVELRNATVKHIKSLCGSVKVDDDRLRLAEYLRSIKTGSGSVVCEIHFNAGPPTATGVETIIPARHTEAERALAEQLSGIISKHTGQKLRGVKGVITEAASQHKTLAIMRPEGINTLIEVCFITNKKDLDSYKANLDKIAKDIAGALISADRLFT